VANYGGLRAIVWEDDGMGWSYLLEGEGVPSIGCQANNKTGAMRGCASLLAARRLDRSDPSINGRVG